MGAVRRAAAVSTDADTDGWQARLRLLLERHPRDSWAGATSSSAAFWLEVHEHLRRDAAGLLAASDDYRRAPAQLAVVATPRLRGLIGAMHGHHQIEDFHYFPAFRQAEPQLAAGFDRLERDHSSLHERVAAALAALDELHAAVARSVEPGTSSSLELATQRYVETAASLCRELAQHLDEEENLVVPLLLEGGGY
jgi:hypothetical protein